MPGEREVREGGSPPVHPPGWLPHAVTGVRFLLLPIFVALAAACRAAARGGEPTALLRGLALAVLLAIVASDFVDGLLARRFGLASRTGALLDAAADKLTHLVGLGYFTLFRGPAFPTLPLWFFLLVVGRDLVLVAGFLAVRGVRGRGMGEHAFHGKVTTALVFGVLVSVTAALPEPTLPVVTVVAAVAAAASGAAYLRRDLRALREARRRDEPARPG